jgi:G3E family GTPase
MAALEERLRAMNPTARLGRSGEDRPLAVDDLLASVADPEVRPREVAHWFDFEALEHRHGLVDSLSLAIEEPLDWASFALWLGMLLNRHGRKVLRVKGILNVRGSEQPVVIHGVQHTIHPPLHLPAWPDGPPRTRLVLIVDDLDTALVERSFRAFMALGG